MDSKRAASFSFSDKAGLQVESVDRRVYTRRGEFREVNRYDHGAAEDEER